MKTLFSIFLSLILTYVFGQSPDDSKYRFPNSVFKTDAYKRSIYQKFDKQIECIGNNFYKFGDKTLKISIDDTTLLVIFKRGIFNPDIVFGTETTHKDKSEFDTLSQGQKTFYNLIRNDSLSICCFEQLEKLNPNDQTKRFKLWVFKNGVVNPTEYYLELYNNKATETTTLKAFLENSVMTFYYQGTLII